MNALSKNLPDYNANPIVLTVPDDFAGLRLDQALSRLLPQYSRSRLQQWLKQRLVTLNGAAAEAKQKVWGGEVLHITPQPDPQQIAFRPESIPLAIVYEDDTLLVINKPPGLVVHPGSGNWSGTLLNALLQHAPQLAAVPRAGIVHRLDKDTSGLLVVAKTIEAQTSLVRQLQARSVKREYLALAQGVIARDGTVEAPIGRHPLQRTKMAVVGHGKPALTHYQVLEQLPGCSLLRCSLETGRTHQIRVHLQSIGHPLLGDPVYGARSDALPAALRAALGDFKRQALHAERLALIHPASGAAVSWQADLPDDMRLLLERVRNSA